MALTDENSMVMPVSPMYGNSGGFGGFGDGGWWILLLFILLGGNAWNNGGFGGTDLYPWMNQSNQFNDGFRDQMINSGIGDIQNSITAGFAGVSSQMYNNQIADMERSFAAQTAQTAGMTALQAQLAQCCCDNRAATADLKYTVATENCADRTAALNNTRDIIDAQTRGTQAILDKLCALELDGVKGQLAQAQRENVGLQNQLNIATMQASQTAQNALITQGFSNEVDALYNRLSACPVPTVPVYGRQPIFTCGGNNACGCGCGCGGVA